MLLDHVQLRRTLQRTAMVGVALAAALAALWWLDAEPAAAQGGDATVDIIDFDFAQKEVSIPVGSTITWANVGTLPHTATDRGGTFDTQPIAPGESGSITFTAPGTYFYFCRINPSKMNATIVVEPGAEPSKAVRIQTIDPGNLEAETLRFDPPQLEVPAGTTVLVANVGGKPHSLSAEDGSFSTGIIPPGPEGGRFAGSNATLTLTQPGTYSFFCDIHPQAMRGTITVTGSPPADAAAPASAAPRTAAVSIVDFEFDQAQVSVAPGGEVTFRNVGEAPHTATFDELDLDTGNLDTGGSATLIAPQQPGTYTYFCAIHTRMRGTLVVLGQNTPDPAALPNTTLVAAPAGDGGGGAAEAATAVTAAPSPSGYAPGGSISGAMKSWVLATVAIGFFLGGVGITPFLMRRRPTA